MENKTGKYIKYALGEILLVMIGILLALQVNNWNEKKKQDAVSIKFLENLKKEVIQNEITLKVKLADHHLVVTKTTELLELMELTPREINSSKLDTLMFAMLLMPEFKPIKTFINSENLGLINDDDLKNLIGLWSHNFDQYVYDLKIIYDLYYNNIYDFMQHNYQMKNVKSEYINLSESKFKVNPINILSSAVFENHVTMKKLNADNVYEGALEISEIQQKIIEKINEKLATDK